MAMIPYPELVAALSNWRARKGLPTEQRSEYLNAATAAPAAAAAARAMPISASPPPRAAAPAAAPAVARAAAPAAAAAAYGTLDDEPVDDGDLDIVAEDDDRVGDSTDMVERARTAANTIDDEATAIAGGFGEGEGEDAYESGTIEAADDDVIEDDDDIQSGELGGGPPPLAPPPGDEEDDDNPWK